MLYFWFLEIIGRFIIDLVFSGVFLISVDDFNFKVLEKYLLIFFKFFFVDLCIYIFFFVILIVFFFKICVCFMYFMVF